MFKHARMLAPAVLAAGAMLLTACDLGGSTGATQQNPSATTPSSTPGKATPAGSTSDSDATSDGGSTEQEPIDCGEVNVGGDVVQTLIAEVGVSGVVSCTAATKVLNEFLTTPTSERAQGEMTELQGGWLCDDNTEDQPETTYYCVLILDGGTDGDHGEDLQFYTKPVSV
jgi:hypothetical protein